MSLICQEHYLLFVNRQNGMNVAMGKMESDNLKNRRWWMVLTERHQRDEGPVTSGYEGRAAKQYVVRWRHSEAKRGRRVASIWLNPKVPVSHLRHRLCDRINNKNNTQTVPNGLWIITSKQRNPIQSNRINIMEVCIEFSLIVDKLIRFIEFSCGPRLAAMIIMIVLPDSNGNDAVHFCKSNSATRMIFWRQCYRSTPQCD